MGIKKRIRWWRKQVRKLAYHRRRIWSAKEAGLKLALIVQEGTSAAIGKIGRVESQALRLYLKHQSQPKSICWGREGERLHKNAGVFPPRPEAYRTFCEVFLESLEHVSHLAVWHTPGESKVVNSYMPNAELLELEALVNTKHFAVWTQHLAAKSVLIIHPFAQSVEKQFQRREKLWPELPGILPDFQLQTIQTPLSAALVESPYPDWMRGLESLKKEMAGKAFDVALIGAGAWSLPLASHARMLGKIGIHLGGITQILFGIKGGRWDREDPISSQYNEYWVRPSETETPANVEIIEKGCYW